MTAPRDRARPRVDLVAPPMAGHLHPVLGIAERLARSCDVRVLTTHGALAVVEACGLTGVGLLRGADDAVAAIVDPPYRVGSDLRLMRRQLRATVALQRDVRLELLAHWRARRPDLVIADFTMVAAGTAATELDLPWWTSHPSPCVIEARSGPPAYVGGRRPGTGATGRAVDAALRAAVRTTKRTAPLWSGARLSTVGVRRLYRADGSETIYSPELVLGLTPPAIEYPRDLPPAVRLVGPVLFTPPARDGVARPPIDLAPGRRHVLVTAGTHLPWHRPAVLAAAAAAADVLPDVEVHVSLGGDDVDPAALPAPPGVVVHRVVDYARDLARFDAVVHHAGSGVLGHTLAAGLPAVVWPVDYDQPDHAVRLVDAGVALALERPERLGEVLRRVLDDPALGAAARRHADAIGRRPALDVIEDTVRSRFPTRQ